MIVEVLEITGDGFAAGQVLRLKVGAIGGKDELGLGPRAGGTGAQFRQRVGNLPGRTGGDMDVVGLQHAAKVGFVRHPAAQAFQRGVLVPKGFQEGIRKRIRVKITIREFRDGLFDFDCVHVVS